MSGYCLPFLSLCGCLFVVGHVYTLSVYINTPNLRLVLLLAGQEKMEEKQLLIATDTGSPWPFQSTGLSCSKALLEKR